QPRRRARAGAYRPAALDVHAVVLEDRPPQPVPLPGGARRPARAARDPRLRPGDRRHAEAGRAAQLRGLGGLRVPRHAPLARRAGGAAPPGQCRGRGARSATRAGGPRGARPARRRAPPAHATGRDTRCGASPGAGGDRARGLPARRARRRRRGAHRRRRRVHRLAAHARPAAPLPRPRAAAPHPLMEVTREQLRDGLRAARYLTTPRVETALFLALVLEKPLLAEGPAGAGKTELAKVLAEMLR